MGGKRVMKRRRNGRGGDGEQREMEIEKEEGWRRKGGKKIEKRNAKEGT